MLHPLVLEMLVREGPHHHGDGEGAHLAHQPNSAACSCTVTLGALLEIRNQMCL